MTAGLEMKFFKTRLRGLFGLALLLLWVVSLSSCILFEYRYPSELIRPTNTIGFQELWSVALENYDIEIYRGLMRRSLLAADLDGDGVKELLVDTKEANRLLLVKDGQMVDELHLQVPGKAFLGLSEVVEGSHLAKILSKGMNLSLVDLTTGEVVKALGEASGDITWYDRLFSEDIDDDGGEELLIFQVLLQEERAIVTARDEQGGEIWRASAVLQAIMYMGDLDNDGRQELLTPDWTMIDCEDGSVTEIKKEPENAIFYAGDIDYDGGVELVAGLGEASTTIGVYDLNGKKRWGYPLSDVGYGVVGDVNGDGKKEIAFFSRDPKFGSQASADHWIFLFDAQGKLLWNHKTHASLLYPGAFVDINADGKDELIFFEQLYHYPRVLRVYGSKQ